MTLEAGSGDYQAGRERKKLFDEVCDSIFRELRGLPAGEGRELLTGVQGALEQEVVAEQRFQREFEAIGEELLRVATPAELARLHRGMAGVVTGHFSRRESVPAFHELCTATLDRVIGQALRLAEEELAGAGFGTAPPYAWLVLGPAGRREATLSTELESLLVHGPGADTAAYCGELAGRTAAILEQCGFRKNGRGITPDAPAWRSSLAGWGERLEELCRRSSGAPSSHPGFRLDEFFSPRTTTLSTPLFELADLRVVAGDPGLGEKLIALAREVTARHPACIQEAAHSVATLPSPFTFLGNYRVERFGAHRGKLDLKRWACLPLVSMVRLQAVTGGIAETGTLERIQLLLRRGALDVALGKRLLQGGLEIFRLMAHLELQEHAGTGASTWFFPDSLSFADEQALREALEGVTTLQQVIYSSLASQG